MSPLTKEPSQRMVVRWYRDGEPDARDALIHHLAPLAHGLAARYRGTKENREDLEQVACLGLIKAIDRYDPERGQGQMIRYAVPMILGELRRHFRDTTWAVHAPRALQERLLKVTRATDTLAARLGRSPTVAEQAAESGYTIEEVHEADRVASAYNPTRLDAPVSDDPGAASLGESLGCIEDGYERTLRRESARLALSELTERDRQLLQLRFFEDLSQSEVAARMGISQMHVSRLLRRALAGLNAQVDTAREVEAA